MDPGRYERSGGIYGTGVGELKASHILKSGLEIPVLILLKFLFYSFYFYLVLFLFVLFAKVTFLRGLIMGVSAYSNLLRKLVCGAVSAIVLITAFPVMAQEEMQQFIELPVQSLDNALEVVSETYGVGVIAPGELVRGKTASPVSGTLNAEEAVSQLLHDSGLVARRSSTGAILVSANEATPPSQDESAITDSNGMPMILMEGITVRGRRSAGYNETVSSGATKIETPIVETPVTINVLSGQLLEDRYVTSIPEIIRSVSNVQVNGGWDESYFIRGFQVERTLRNGMITQPALVNSVYRADVENLERIEVIKGPNSVLYGQIEPGGVVNYVTKRPLDERHISAQFDIGTFDLYRIVGDITGPLTDSKNLLARLNIAYQNNEAERDFVQQERYLIAPALEWRINDRTTLSANAEYLKRDNTIDLGFLPIIYGDPNGEVYLELPRDRFLGEPDDYVKTEQFVAQSILDHEFSDSWSLGLNLQYTNFKQEEVGASFIFPDFVNPLTEVYRSFADPVERDAYSYQAQANLKGEFSTGPVDHKMFVGVEYREGRVDYYSMLYDAANLNIFDPVYGQPPLSAPELSSFHNNQDDSKTIALSFQDNIGLGERWNLLLGGRYEKIDLTREYVRGPREGELKEQDDYVFTPQVGLLFQPTPETSLYANYSESFIPQFRGIQANGDLLPPSEGNQVEIGAKADLFGGRAIGSVALFEIEKTNISVPDPNEDPYSGYRVPTGLQRSRGIEFDLRGEVTDNLEIVAFYAYTDAEVVEDTVIPVGDRLPFVSEHTASIWAKYSFKENILRGLSIGAGCIYYSDTETSLPNVVTLDDYMLVDASITYERDKWRTGLHFKNILDELYFNGSVPQNGFSAMASIARTF